MAPRRVVLRNSSPESVAASGEASDAAPEDMEEMD